MPRTGAWGAGAGVSEARIYGYLAARAGNPQGCVQSVSRVEAYAILDMMLQLPENPEIISDCSSVVERIRKLPRTQIVFEFSPVTNLVDLMWDIFRNLVAGSCSTQLVWGNSHLKPFQYVCFNNWKDYVSNDIADYFAGYAASKCQVDPDVQRRVHEIDSRIPLILEPIAAIDGVVRHT